MGSYVVGNNISVEPVAPQRFDLIIDNESETRSKYVHLCWQPPGQGAASRPRGTPGAVHCGGKEPDIWDRTVRPSPVISEDFQFRPRSGAARPTMMALARSGRHPHVDRCEAA